VPHLLGLRRREILANGKIARTWVEVDKSAAATIRTIFTEYATGIYSPSLWLARSTLATSSRRGGPTCESVEDAGRMVRPSERRCSPPTC